MPDTYTVNPVHRFLPVISPESEGVHHSHDTFIRQTVVEGGFSENMKPSECTIVSTRITNQLSSNIDTDEHLNSTGRRIINEVSDRISTSRRAIASLTNLSLDSGTRTAAPSILSTVGSDSGGYRGLAEAAEKLTNTCQRPDERLSYVAAASQYHRVGARAHERDLSAHIPYVLTERKAFLDQRHRARLALALEPAPAPNSELSEIELGAMPGSLGNNDQKLTADETRHILRNSAFQRCVAAVMGRLMDRSCAWLLLGFWVALVFSVALPM